MKPRIAIILCVVLAAIVFSAVVVAAHPTGGSGQAQAQAPGIAPGTGFTYQGQLKNGGAAVNGACDFQFALYDALALGARIGATQTVSSLAIANGLFTAPLDFGSGAMDGDARFLDMQVRCPAGAGVYAALTPRQPLTPSPIALSLPGLWTQQNATSPNLIGGYSGNVISPAVIGSVIGGGGENGYINRVTANVATIAGGEANLASGPASTVGGGFGNVVTGVLSSVGGGNNNLVTADYSTISGGQNNIASGPDATIGGGTGNFAGGNASAIGGGSNISVTAGSATVAGGNTITVSGAFAAVGGGHFITATGIASVIGGGQFNSARGDQSTIAGGNFNTVSGTVATIAGGQSNAALNTSSAVGGGNSNTASGPSSTIGGGTSNTVGGGYSAVGGGNNNMVGGNYSTIPGGFNNMAGGDFSMVAGGSSNTASGQLSFAAGFNANTNNQPGAFVWADDSVTTTISATAPNQFIVRAFGGVGINTNSPETQLHVKKSANGTATSPSDNVVVIENTNTGNSADVLALKIGGTVSPTASNNFVTFLLGNNTSVGAIQGNGSGSVEYVGGGNDYAEWLPRLDLAESLTPGDIVGIVGGRVTRDTRAASQIMVVSTAPLVSGNDPGEAKRADYEKVAFIGQALVKVRGAVHSGDFIVPSGQSDGVGVAVAPQAISTQQFSQVLGQAWEASDELNVKTVRVAVGLIQHDPTVQRLVENNAAQGEQLASLEARLSAVEKGSGAPNEWMLLVAVFVAGVVLAKIKR